MSEDEFTGRMDLPDGNGVLIRNMPYALGPWLPNEMLEEAQRLGARAGDTVRCNYRRTGGEMVFEVGSVVIERNGEVVVERSTPAAGNRRWGFGIKAGATLPAIDLKELSDPGDMVEP